MSVTGAIEGQMFRKTGQLIPLSVQNLVDCCRYKEIRRDCNFGSSFHAFMYVMDNGGIESEATYPYETRVSGFFMLLSCQACYCHTVFAGLHIDMISM